MTHASCSNTGTSSAKKALEKMDEALDSEEEFAYGCFLYSPVWRISGTVKDSKGVEKSFLTGDFKASLNMLHDGVETESTGVKDTAARRITSVRDKLRKISLRDAQEKIINADVFPRTGETFASLKEKFEEEAPSDAFKKKKRSSSSKSECDEDDEKETRRRRKPNKTEKWVKEKHGKKTELQVIKTSAVFACALGFQQECRRYRKRKKRRVKKSRKPKLKLTKDERCFLKWIRETSRECGVIRHELSKAAQLMILKAFGSDDESAAKLRVRKSLYFSFVLLHSLILIEPATGEII